jgi:hypothetical protein
LVTIGLIMTNNLVNRLRTNENWKRQCTTIATFHAAWQFANYIQTTNFAL